MLHLALQPCHKVTKPDFQSEFSMSKIWLFFVLAFLKPQNHHQILMTLALFIKRTKQQDWKVFQVYRLSNLKLPSALCAGGLFRALYSAQELLQLLNFQTIYYKNKSVFFIPIFWSFPNLCTKNLWYTVVLMLVGINAFLALFWAYVGQPDDHIGWATLMPFVSIYSTNPRNNP